MLVEELSKALEHTISHSKLRKAVGPTVDVADHSIKENDDEILILKPFSSFEQYSPSNVGRLMSSWSQMLFSHAFLTKLNLPPTQLVCLTGLVLVLELLSFLRSLLRNS